MSGVKLVFGPRILTMPFSALLTSLRGIVKPALAAVLPRRVLTMTVPAASGAACLTFDDGPHPEHTPALLDELKRLELRGSFFVVGAHAAQWPELVRRAAEEGHAIAHHSYWHRLPRLTSATQLRDEIRRTANLLEDIIGQDSPLFRPPQGRLDPAKLLMLQRERLTTVLWNADPRDYQAGSAEDVRAWFRARPPCAGDIVLMHDHRPFAAAVLEELARARDVGVRFVTVPEALGFGTPRQGD